jgi:uncharacterized OB-fold protein
MEYKQETTSIAGSWYLAGWQWKFESMALIQKSMEGFKHKKMIGNKCPGCGLVYFLPKPFCRCLSRPDEFVEIKDVGTVTTYTFSGAWSYGGITDEGPTGTPYIIAGVVFDGSDTMTVSLIEDAEPEQMFVGMRVKIKWPEDMESSSNIVVFCTPA